eukprot:TRINITY_DN6241_c0_g1_i1.p1 TRINITY_DN6241_c0_g1~~TRINITY_DN6241_c0_g1_i1.p1  ORF type:complete len:990 (+),score=277.46 TRINITY_DN6241_c0_g1_i1:119-3088(+)
MLHRCLPSYFSGGRHRHSQSIASWIRNTFLRSTILTTVSVSLVGLAVITVIVVVFSLQSNSTQLHLAHELMSQTTSRATSVLTGAFSAYATGVLTLAETTAKLMEEPRVPSLEEQAKYGFDEEFDVPVWAGKHGLTWEDSDVWLGQLAPTPCDNPARDCNRTITPEEIEVYGWRSGAVTGLLKAIYDYMMPKAAQSYINFEENLCRIYPPRELLLNITYAEQIQTYLNISNFNFYYLGADSPGKAAWTGAYVDPAGQGWMISSVAAVKYPTDTGHLWGVAGLDMLLGTLISDLESIPVDWDGYIIVLDVDGVIVGLPAAGNADWGLSELGVFNYSTWTSTETYKPDDWNVFLREDCIESGMSEALENNRQVGRDTIHFGGEKKEIAWEQMTIDPRWTVMVIAPSSNVRAQQRRNAGWLAFLACSATTTVALIMAGVVLVLALLSSRISKRICAKLAVVNQGLSLISDGRFDEISRHGCHVVDPLSNNGVSVSASGNSIPSLGENAVHPVLEQSETASVSSSASGDIQELEESIQNVQVVARNLKQKTTQLAETQAGYRKFVPEEMVRLMFLKDNGPADILSVKPGDSTESALATMFVDIRDFTVLSQRFQREDIMRLLNAFANEVVPVCKKYNGAIDKYMGDAVLVVFHSWTDALLAANAVVSSISSISINGRANSASGDHTPGSAYAAKRIPMEVGIGFCYGRITVGIIGTMDRMELTVIGDAVNEASRIEGLTKYFGASVLFTVTAALEEITHFSCCDCGVLSGELCLNHRRWSRSSSSASVDSESAEAHYNKWNFPHLKHLVESGKLGYREDLYARFLGFVRPKGKLSASPLYELLCVPSDATAGDRSVALERRRSMDRLKYKYALQFKQLVVDPFAARKFPLCLQGLSRVAALYREDIETSSPGALDAAAWQAYHSLEALGTNNEEEKGAGRAMYFKRLRTNPALLDGALLVYAARAVLYAKRGCDEEEDPRDPTAPLSLQFDEK